MDVNILARSHKQAATVTLGGSMEGRKRATARKSSVRRARTLLPRTWQLQPQLQGQPFRVRWARDRERSMITALQMSEFTY
jgi:hypothetical protein